MRQYTADNLVVHPNPDANAQLVVEVTPELAGWDTIHFQVRRLRAGEQWSFGTQGNEFALVMLGGTVNVASNRGQWSGVGTRANVFAGPPHALYLPPHTDFTVTAATECEFAATWVASDAPHAPVLITPTDVGLEIRGGDHATRHINNIIPPGFPCERLVVVEVYTPGGNWSSYPPHKHDTDDRSLDEAMAVEDGDVTLVPRGYHPCAACHGYDLYYLNVMAGPKRTWKFHNAPEHEWLMKA